MNENEDFGFEDFESELFGDDYQTDAEPAEETVEADDTEASEQEDSSDDTDGAGSEESEEGDDDHTSEEEGTESDGKADGTTPAGQNFTIKVNKEERTVSLDEMKTLAQKGADYDRVKEQNNQRQQTITELQTKLDSMAAQQNVLDILGIIAERSGASLDQLAESLYVNFRRSSGASEDVAKEELKSARLQKELDTVKAKNTQQQSQETDAEARAKRDLEDFSREYPDVKLDNELVDKLVPDIQSGMTLTAAYRKYEKAQDAAKIAELERKLAAKAQNDKNKKSSPGSQKDSGSRRVKSDYDIFEKALFG